MYTSFTLANSTQIYLAPETPLMGVGVFIRLIDSSKFKEEILRFTPLI